MDISTSMWTDCKAGYDSYKAALEECRGTIEPQPSCGYGWQWDYSQERCVESSWSCTSEEEYDFILKRCVPKGD